MQMILRLLPSIWLRQFKDCACAQPLRATTPPIGLPYSRRPKTFMQPHCMSVVKTKISSCHDPMLAPAHVSLPTESGAQFARADCLSEHHSLPAKLAVLMAVTCRYAVPPTSPGRSKSPNSVLYVFWQPLEGVKNFLEKGNSAATKSP